MGRKTSATLQRFGIPFVGPNRFVIKPFLPFELRSSFLDRYGWDRSEPPLYPYLGKQQYRLSFQLDFILTQILIQYLQTFNIILLRLRLKQHNSHFSLHIFYLPSRSFFVPKNKSKKKLSSSLTLSLPTGVISNNVLTDSLTEFLILKLPLVLIWHPVEFTSIPLAPLNNHLRRFQYLFSKKDKLLFIQGVQLFAIIPTYNCNYALAIWTARVLESIKRPKLLISLFQRVTDFWSQQDLPCYLKGFQIKVKGRLGGVDMATRMFFSWGTLSRQTLSFGVTSRFAPAYTLQGLYGVRIYTHYQ